MVNFFGVFPEKPCSSIGKFWGNVGAHRDILEIPDERGPRSGLGSPASGISKMFLLTQSSPLSFWVLLQLYTYCIHRHIERGDCFRWKRSPLFGKLGGQNVNLNDRKVI